MKHKVMKVGNSLGVTVPANFAKNIGIFPGCEVEVKQEPEKGKLVYYFGGIRQLVLSDILKSSEQEL